MVVNFELRGEKGFATTLGYPLYNSVVVISDPSQLFDCDQSQLQASAGQDVETRNLLEVNKQHCGS